MKFFKPSALLLTAFFLGTLHSEAQTVSPTSAQDLNASIEQRSKLAKQTLFANYPIRNVGPVVMSGRVTDIAVHPDNPRIFYIGYGSAGVFKSTNSGNTMTPVFDHAGGALGVGDLTISEADPNIIWVGTGENNSSRSTYAGSGIYKSSDNGETWEFKGLNNSQHIGRIITHPTDANTAWVASVGALYSPNSERGVFKTTDGGNSWEKTLFINDSTGVIDLAIHPTNPNILWAASWEKDRKAWNFKESGKSSAIYKSSDGGNSWTKLTNGLPQGEHVGRIGLDVSKSMPNTIYAIIDNQFETKTERDVDVNVLSMNDLTEMRKRDFLRLDDKKLNQYLRSNRFPSEYTAESVKEDVRKDKYQPRALADFLGDANAALFNTEIIGPEIYRSDDAGESWSKVNSYDLDNIFFTYGYYFGQIRVDPNDAETLYIWGVPFLKSTDGGKTWTPKAENQRVHVDHHALWINPEDSEHIILGNDGGLYESHDGGDNFIHHNSIPVGQFYSVNVDMDEPYNIYGGLQDNGTFMGPSTSTGNRSQPWTRIGGGDGMHVSPNPKNSDIVYVGSQYGNYSRRDFGSGQTNRITPRHSVGEDRYRYNWNSPINLSHHNPEIVYFGSQRLNRSLDEGKTWTAISPDLTNNLPNGDVPYSTISTIAESPISFDVIWVGTDDGNIQLTRDGGATWTNVSSSLPQKRWVSEVHASKYDEGTAFVSLNGYRYDEFKTYIYKTTDYGKTWKSIKGDLPEDVVNVIVQDPVEPSILYTGLDHGSYVSFNEGKNWHFLSTMPNVASYDMIVHPRDLELVIGTHGRSIYVMDVKPLHVVASRLDEPITAIAPETVRSSRRWGFKNVEYRDRIMPEVSLLYYIGSKNGVKEIDIEVRNSDDEVVSTLTASGSYGFNTYSWDLVTGENEGAPVFLTKGKYTLSFKNGRNSHEVEFEVK